MVKSADNRIRKYTAKFDATVASNRVTAIKDLAVAEFGVGAAEGAALEATIKQALEPVLTSPTEIPNYLAAAREIAAKARRYGGQVLFNEAQAVKIKWVARGLDSGNLDIVLQACGINVSLYGS